MLLHLLFDMLELARIHPFRDGKDGEERGGEHQASDSGDLLGCKIYQRGGEQHHKNREQTERNFFATKLKVGRDLPAALAFVLEAQHQHSQAIEREAPDHSKGVRFTEYVHISTA